MPNFIRLATWIHQHLLPAHLPPAASIAGPTFGLEELAGRKLLALFDGETLGSFYAELRSCRARCDRRARFDHQDDQ